MDLGLNGRRAAVAAASAGLGYATAAALAADGAPVAICGRDRARVDDAAASIGHGAIGVRGRRGQRRRGGRLRRRRHRSARGRRHPRHQRRRPAARQLRPARPSTPTSRRSTSTCCPSWPCARRRCRRCRSSGGGRVVAITSISVRQPIAGLILSNTARAGATGFLKTLAREVATDGVTVNSVLPGCTPPRRITALYGSTPRRRQPASRAGIDRRPGRLRSGRGVPVLGAGAVRHRRRAHGRRRPRRGAHLSELMRDLSRTRTTPHQFDLRTGGPLSLSAATCRAGTD